MDLITTAKDKRKKLDWDSVEYYGRNLSNWFWETIWGQVTSYLDLWECSQHFQMAYLGYIPQWDVFVVVIDVSCTNGGGSLSIEFPFRFTEEGNLTRKKLAGGLNYPRWGSDREADWWQAEGYGDLHKRHDGLRDLVVK